MKMTTNIEGEVNGMCNLSDLIVEKTEKRVTEEVTTKVTAEELLKSVTNLMENLNLSLEKACEALGKTVEEYNNAKQFIKQK